MKRFLYLVISIVFLVILSSCASGEQSEMQEDIDAVSTIISEIPLDTSCIATINIEKLEIESINGIYTFYGNAIQDENNSDFVLSDCFEEMRETGILCHQDPVELTIRFSDEIPSVVMWSQNYFRAATDAFPNSTSKEPTTIENLNEEIVLQLGNNISVLDSSIHPEKTYRIIRLICQYDNKNMEYYIIFDGWPL